MLASVRDCHEPLTGRNNGGAKMTDNSQVPWTDEQWARVNNVIQEEASRARVAATFLPMVGPLPPDADFVRWETVNPIPGAPAAPLTIEDRTTLQLATLQVRVQLRGAQMQDPELTSALSLFRRAANILSRLEDGIVFDGLFAPGPGRQLPPQLPAGAVPAGIVPPRAAMTLPLVWQITSAVQNDGLFEAAARANQFVDIDQNPPGAGQRLVGGVSGSIGGLEARGQFGPYAVVLGQDLFEIAQTPDPPALVLPQDRIIPFLGGGSLLRSSALLPAAGVVVALGGAPVELVVATDMSLQFLQITQDPAFLFRVFERIALRIKDPGAITALRPE
jgi:uncharacterized linocin/CFP29 family protein